MERSVPGVEKRAAEAALEFFMPATNRLVYDTNSQRQSVQWVGRRCCAAGYAGRAAARPYRLEYVPIIIGK
jgi:hypothetical protein